MFELDKETKKIMQIFKTVENKQEIADILAKQTVTVGVKNNNSTLYHYYGKDEPVFVTVSCISFGLMNFMEEDFYIVKEVVGYDVVFNMLKKQKRYLEVM